MSWSLVTQSDSFNGAHLEVTFCCRQAGKAGPSDKPEDKDNTIILTSTFVDSNPKTANTALSRPQRQERVESAFKQGQDTQSNMDPAIREMLQLRRGKS